MKECKECGQPTAAKNGICAKCKTAMFEEAHPEYAADQDGLYGWAKREAELKREYDETCRMIAKCEARIAELKRVKQQKPSAKGPEASE